MSDLHPRVGWESDFPTFRDTAPRVIRESLQRFIEDASLEQVRAWRDSIPPLQQEVGELMIRDALSSSYSAILEYELPMDLRRPDVVLLAGRGVIVLELKGKRSPSRADLDQVSAYARDLRCYHRECANRPVYAVVVPTLASGYQQEIGGVHVTGPDGLDQLIERLSVSDPEPVLDRRAFLSADAYSPLPTLVEAARELFERGSLRPIHRARAATEPTVDAIKRLAHTAAMAKSRHLVLISGVPGAGKTLVGLQAVHARYLDELSVARTGGRPSTPAVFLSGNGPLVEVLQYELRQAGGGGKTFVRGVKPYVNSFLKSNTRVPAEHVLVFDEAQRAYDAQQMQHKHGDHVNQSEPATFVQLADRIPEWCVIVGLIGTGQEIHVGEEGGVRQWLEALEESPRVGEWTVHASPDIARQLHSPTVEVFADSVFNLNTELRFHSASDVAEFVAQLLHGVVDSSQRLRASALADSGYHLRMSRNLNDAKAYLQERYSEDPSARFGLLASSRDKDLVRFGIPNDFQSTKRLRLGPWYGDDEGAEGARSCRYLRECVTEFGAQGLELDGALIAWGTDLLFENGTFSNRLARNYKAGTTPRDPLQLRLNAYRVLLTRGRDCSVVFVPPLPELDAVAELLESSGFEPV